MSNSHKETEVTIYAKISDFNGLEKAVSFEDHEQYEIKSKDYSGADIGRTRVRRTKTKDKEFFTLTIKKKFKSKNVQKMDETEQVIDETTFKAFKSICPDGMYKRRFIFLPDKISINGKNSSQVDKDTIKYEVDVFYKEDGSFYEWCKIDIELDSLQKAIADEHGASDIKLKFMIDNLAFKPIDYYTASSANEEQLSHMSNLYKYVFRFKNSI